MAGIYIPGMEMPTSCGFCPFENHTDDGYECRINGCLTEYQKRPSDCPLVSVPPHGRLIDADALYREIKAECNPYGKPSIGYDDGLKVLGIIGSTPPVIPAEKEVEINFCGDCHWHEAEEQYCFRKGCHTYDESSCEHWEPMPADEPIPAPGGETDPTTYDLLYEEGGYSGNGI